MTTIRLFAGLLLALAPFASIGCCEGAGPPALSGTWVVDVEATREAFEGDVEDPTSAWLKQLEASEYQLEFKDDGTFTLQVGKDVMPVSLGGTWERTEAGAAITLTTIGDEMTPEEGRTVEQLRRDGHHLVLPQNEQQIYLERVDG